MGDPDAEWAKARLVHTAAALGRLQHDMRNMLAPSMLTAERLQLSDVASIKRAGDITVRGAERLNAAIGETLGLLRDGLRRPDRVAVELSTVLDEVATRWPGVARRGSVPDDLSVTVDPPTLTAALDALFAAAGSNALSVDAEAEARTVRLRVTIANAEMSIDRAAAPYLAICREYILALHGMVSVEHGGLTLELPA